MCLENLVCSKCGKKYEGVKTANLTEDLCDECNEILKENQKKEFINNLREGKTLEERIDFLENYVYNELLTKRITDK